MNDFTKEELEIIKLAISDMVLINGEDSEKSILYKKIQSLIDNYPTHCEHSGVKLK